MPSNVNHRGERHRGRRGRSVFLVIRSGLNSDCSSEDDGTRWLIDEREKGTDRGTDVERRLKKKKKMVTSDGGHFASAASIDVRRSNRPIHRNRINLTSDDPVAAVVAPKTN